MVDKKQAPQAPDFTAADSEGNPVRLSSYKGKKNVVLVFNRGFFWPHCRKHLAQLRQDYQQFVDRDTEVIAVGPDDAASFQKWWHNHKIPFIGIPDPNHAIAEGIYSQKFKLIKGGRLPAMAVIDKFGKIRLMHYADSTSDIPSNEEILALLEELNK